MGKAKKQQSTAPAKEMDEDDKLFAQRAVELKDEGNRLLESRQFKAAAAAFDQGLKLMAPGDPSAAVFHCNRAECFFHLRQYADVVVEATRALKLSPKYEKALTFRALAYNNTGQAKKAKADAAAAVALNPKSEDAKVLAASFEPKKEGPAGLGGLGLAPPKKGGKAAASPAPDNAAMEAARKQAEARAAIQAKQRQQQQAWGPPITVKAQCGDDIRSIIVPSMISHKDLMTSLQKKFPDNSAFTVRYTAEDGSLRPLNTRADFAAAAAAAAAAKAASGTAKPTLHGIPSVKLTLTELARLDAPKVEDAATEAAGAAETSQLAPNEVVEIDEWILDFAALFREHLGIDAEAHLDLHAEGLEKCNEALEAAATMADADEMLKTASSKFQEAAALALFNWGNVHMCAARKAMDGGRDPPVEEGDPPGAAVATAERFDEVVDHLDKAKGRYEAALGVKADFHDASIALAQRRYERARLLCAAAGLSGDGNAPQKGHDGAKRAKEAEEEFEAACKDFLTVLGQLPEEPSKEKKEEAAAAAAGEKKEGEAGEAGDAAAEEPSMRAQVLVMWGNTLFEHSQMCARLKKEWRPLLDTAITKFQDAGCAQSDIDQALKVHRGVRAEKK